MPRAPICCRGRHVPQAGGCPAGKAAAPVKVLGPAAAGGARGYARGARGGSGLSRRGPGGRGSDLDRRPEGSVRAPGLARLGGPLPGRPAGSVSGLDSAPRRAD